MCKDQLLWVKIVVWILILLFIIARCNKSEASHDILDEKIKRFCYEHKGSKYENFWEFWKSNWFRCTAILQAIYRFETWHLKSYQWNNIFNFKAPTCRKEWIDKYWCEVKNWFLRFPDKTKGIEFAIDRYYKYDVYKTIWQIIGGWYYCSPVSWWCWNINWYTHTKEDQPYYIDFVKKYFNKLKIWKN